MTENIDDAKALFFNDDGTTCYYVINEKFYSETYHVEPIEIEFSELLRIYLIEQGNEYFLDLIESYIRLCEQTIGIDYKHIVDQQSLEDVVELFFRQKE